MHVRDDGDASFASAAVVAAAEPEAVAMRNPWAAWGMAGYGLAIALGVTLAVVPWDAVAGFLAGMVGHL